MITKVAAEAFVAKVAHFIKTAGVDLDILGSKLAPEDLQRMFDYEDEYWANREKLLNKHIGPFPEHTKGFFQSAESAEKQYQTKVKNWHAAADALVKQHMGPEPEDYWEHNVYTEHSKEVPSRMNAHLDWLDDSKSLYANYTKGSKHNEYNIIPVAVPKSEIPRMKAMYMANATAYHKDNPNDLYVSKGINATIKHLDALAAHPDVKSVYVLAG